MTRSSIPARVNERRLTNSAGTVNAVLHRPNPARVLRAGAWTIAAAYGGCWAAGLIPWWVVSAYAAVLTIALAETD